MSKSVFTILTKSEKKTCEDVVNEKTSLYEHDDLYNKLYDFYTQSGEMPYSAQKARDMDPMTWITNKLEEEFSKLQ